jgi:branched-chain amino acid transport system ATP-binding protein
VNPLLAIEGLDACYGPSLVLHGLSMTVSAGEAVLLLGRNGAGKTTTMRTIMGLVATRAGRISYMEREILGLPPHRIAQLGIGLVPEDRRMFSRLTVRENLELGRKPAPDGNSSWNMDRVIGLFPALASLLDQKSGTLSGGQKQMVAIARTLMGNASLLLLDEPAEGLAPVIVDGLSAQLVALRAQGLSMILSEQNLTFARALADRVYVMESGTIRYQGTMAELDADPDAWTRYVAF